MNESTITSETPEATYALGMKIGAHLGPGDLIFLVGDLGAGKTVMVKGICEGAGVDNLSWVRSPTFTMILDYPGPLPVRHVDLYRVDTFDEYESIGLFDAAFSGVTLIEWADRAPESLLGHGMTITIDDLGGDQRRITIKADQTILNSIGF